ncbi:M20/M25/M40 family metallo-hydrolase [Roseivirga pacifica]|uniref:M20/M25/M40 family metallo-hydrolase n=1 Tax=Roseivirga pacifica TaxID=1267423 RepID=UPI002094D3A2|nr:M20/M25/M40 family metallo-hydrolase [Roseivirga pacifica]MCO6358804.1 M20/M25/M40 family metallo-hydrolase [Roseivirga pacifica]MCO6365560.1 M20/M25/M40 family metallo-hydrolase [Roseivirga pacifica]MCO6371710.1 M20/M25/M40 family metallo-hydrolase [Roseivirga pacifica]MCO6376179.1 M20/M25/M40 family metallo-hydrolase [Roseivirga pacifica]MCO6379088.1 M20/M25/M40 family metallo-hydrolase [Roseivirga pacifica]
MNYFSRLSLLLIFCYSISLNAQKIKPKDYDALALEYAQKSVATDLKDFLSIPNNALITGHAENNLAYLKKEFEKRGFTTELLPTVSKTAFFSSLNVAKAEQTVLFYMHFDGQPVDPTKWLQEDAYKPVLKERTADGWEEVSWNVMEEGYDDELRVFARSASDDKSPITMFLQAMDILKDRKQLPKFNVKVILDPEEEQGSKGMPDAVDKYREKLTADHMVILDGPIHDSNQPTLVFGCRGIATFELTVFGPRLPQHSGHFGNYAPNPALRLSQLLASMKSETGVTTIPGFYDGIGLTPEIRSILAAVPDDTVQIKKRVGIAETDKVGKNYQEAMQYPSLNIRGMSSGWVGDEARTIVPDKATATIDIRLVPETDGNRLVGLVKQHIEDAGYYIIEGREPTEEERMKYGKIIRFDYDADQTWKAFNTPINSPTGQWLYSTLKEAHNEEVARIRLAGGSVPIAFFVNGLGVPAILVPVVNPDNNQHSPNENLRLGHYKNGIKTALAILNSDVGNK